MKRYNGPAYPSGTMAVIENGVYAAIESCDGTKFGPFQNKITVLPGNHTIALALRTQSIGNEVVYSGEVAYLTFNAEAGHTYVAYAGLIEYSGWVARIKDKKTDEPIAQSDVLPIEAEHRSI